MTREELITNIMDIIKGMEEDELAVLWNEYCSSVNDIDSEVYNMEMFDDLFSGLTPTEIATRVFYGHDEWDTASSFNPNREYLYFNGYGNPVSIDFIGWNEYADKFNFDNINYGIDELVEDIIDGNLTTYNDDINELLEQLED